MVPYVLAFPGEPLSTSPELEPTGGIVSLPMLPVAEEVFLQILFPLAFV